MTGELTVANSGELDFETTPSFNLTVTVTDAGGRSDTATVTITITNVNEAPTATNMDVTMLYVEDTPLDLTDITIADVDSPNVTATLTLSDLSAGVLSTATSGSVTSTFVAGVWRASGAIADVNTLLSGVLYTPALNYDSPFSIDTSVDDGVAAPITNVITVNSTPVNDAPTTGGTYNLTSTDENTTSTAVQVSAILSDASISAGDVDGDTLGIAVFAKTGLGTWEYSTNGVSGWTDFGAADPNAAVLLSETTWIRYVPDGANGETADFDFRAWDQSADSASVNGTPSFGDTTPGGGATPYSSGGAQVSLDITPVNDAPTTSPVTLTAIAEDSGARIITQAELLANAADVDGDGLSATGLAISAGGGTLVDNGDGTWNYTPAVNDDTSVTFSYTITDGTDSVAGSATLDITPVNDAPTTTPVTLTAIAEDSGARTITQAELLANAADVDGDGLTATSLAISAGAGTLVDNGDGTWNYTPAGNDDTSVSFSYTITDGTDSVAGTATLDITPVNDAPTTTPVTLTAIAEDSGARTITQAELLANAGDIEGDGLTATGLTISAGSGTPGR